MRCSLVLLIAFVSIALVAGCQTSSSFAPAMVDARVVRAGAVGHADEKTLKAGRDLFTSRCIECHTLPPISRYFASAWPSLVDKMARRADLKPSERNAIVAYIVAVRKTQ